MLMAKPLLNTKKATFISRLCHTLTNQLLVTTIKGGKP